MDLFVDGKYVSQFSSDGLIVATPSGSSAYSMSAGGSLVAPYVPSVLITAICPHMLTARPLVLPSSATVDVKVPEKVRTLPIVSFDGMNEQELERGEHVENLLKKIIVSSVEDRTRIYVFISEWAFVKYQ